MAECHEDEESERAIFRDKTKTKTGYGSCASVACVSAAGYPSLDNAEYYIKHDVKDGESLASIALRYGLKSSHVQRINHLWTDCILWHSVLFIPILSLDLIPEDYEGEILSKTMLSISRLHRDQHESRNGKEETLAPDLDSAAEYFAKFDMSLAQIKDSLGKFEKKSNAPHHNSNDSLHLLSNKEANHTSHTSYSSGTESLDPSREPEIKFLSQSRSSKVRASTRERLESAQDKLFQL